MILIFIRLMYLATKKEYKPITIRAVFYSLWILLALFQSGFSNLIPDEAYYWRYSQDMSWGYFDHPPVIAAMIKTGNLLMTNEIGVRLLSIVAFTATIFLTEVLTRTKNLLLFYLSVASIAVLQILGILAVPDVPLIFFTVTFFWLYKAYLLRPATYLVILLSFNVALLLLSKYHGILVIFFSILSNLKLLRRPSFWVIVMFSSLLFLPHVLWQWQHDFPSVKYHLTGRHSIGYDINNMLSYIGGIFLILAPATGIVLFYFSIKHSSETRFERALKFNLIGGLLFFFFMSFRGRTEANWTLHLSIPILILGFNDLLKKNWSEKFIKISFIITTVLMLTGRVIIIDGLWNINTNFTRWKQWATAIKMQAGNTPVAFMNSYQNAAEYEFYSGEKAFTLNNVMGRKDQYSLWNDEDSYQGKEIMLIPNYYQHGLNSFETAKGNINNSKSILYAVINNFRSSTNIEITPLENTITSHPGDSVTISFTIKVKDGAHIDADANTEYPMYISYQLFKDKALYSSTTTGLKLSNAMLNAQDQLNFRIHAPEEKGKFTLLISVSTGWLPPSINGGKILIRNK